jgi:hypothetical protein
MRGKRHGEGLVRSERRPRGLAGAAVATSPARPALRGTERQIHVVKASRLGTLRRHWHRPALQPSSSRTLAGAIQDRVRARRSRTVPSRELCICKRAALQGKTDRKRGPSRGNRAGKRRRRHRCPLEVDPRGRSPLSTARRRTRMLLLRRDRRGMRRLRYRRQSRPRHRARLRGSPTRARSVLAPHDAGDRAPRIARAGSTCEVPNAGRMPSYARPKQCSSRRPIRKVAIFLHDNRMHHPASRRRDMVPKRGSEGWPRRRRAKPYPCARACRKAKWSRAIKGSPERYAQST